MPTVTVRIVSEAIQPHPGVLAWLDRQVAPSLCLASVTLAELWFGIGALPTGRRQDALARTLEGALPRASTSWRGNAGTGTAYSQRRRRVCCCACGFDLRIGLTPADMGPAPTPAREPAARGGVPGLEPEARVQEARSAFRLV